MALHETPPLREDELRQKDEPSHIRVRDLHKSLVMGDRLESLGLAGTQKKVPGERSGGMRKRVGLARALVLQPEILIYEEATRPQ